MLYRDEHCENEKLNQRFLKIFFTSKQNLLNFKKLIKTDFMKESDIGLKPEIYNQNNLIYQQFLI